MVSILSLNLNSLLKTINFGGLYLMEILSSGCVFNNTWSEAHIIAHCSANWRHVLFFLNEKTKLTPSTEHNILLSNQYHRPLRIESSLLNSQIIRNCDKNMMKKRQEGLTHVINGQSFTKSSQVDS